LYVYVMEVPLSWYEVELDEIVNAAGPTESRLLFKKCVFTISTYLFVINYTLSIC